MGSTYALMFEVLDGGVSNPIEWGEQNLQSDRIIMTLDEENETIWLWHGKKRGLVSRRTALRQAESLKGHGYTVGRSIIGRNVNKIVEIEERKIGRVRATDEANDLFMSLLAKSVNHVGNNVVSFGGPSQDDALIRGKGEAAPAPKPKAEPKPEPKPMPKPEVKTAPAPKPKAEPKSMPKPEVKTAPAPVSEPEPDFGASEYADDEDVPEPEPTPAPAAKAEPKPSINAREEAQKGLVIMAVMSQFSDIWASSQDDGWISIEQMNGNVCKFRIEQGKIKFGQGSFSKIEPEAKDAIKKRFYELLQGL